MKVRHDSRSSYTPARVTCRATNIPSNPDLSNNPDTCPASVGTPTATSWRRPAFGFQSGYIDPTPARSTPGPLVHRAVCLPDRVAPVHWTLLLLDTSDQDRRAGLQIRSPRCTASKPRGSVHAAMPMRRAQLERIGHECGRFRWCWHGAPLSGRRR